ncbi:MAG TPA: HAD family hydrolase [Chloroflexota bacterium]|nr:HAD family hydrolase [Chloroflexota bacterium]
MPAPVQAVSFDLWQTLMHDTKEQAQKRAGVRAAGMQAALARAGFGASLQQVEDACHAIWQEWETRYWDKLVDPGFDAQIAWLCQRLGVPAGAQPFVGDLRAAYVEPVFALPPSVDPAAVPVLSQLHARGLELGLICNTSVTPGFALRRLLAGWGLDRLLSVQLFSDEVRIRKPAPAIYREAARQLGVDIAAMVHVGDRPDVDVEGAILAGARGLQVGPAMPLSELALQLRQIE